MTQDSRPNRKANGDAPSVRFETTLAADIHAISPIVEAVMRAISQLDFAADKGFEIEMALREALANAILHGCKGDSSKKIECSVTGDMECGIQIVVRDPGPGFDPAKLTCPTEGQNLFADHGRGIYLISTLMDEVKYEHNGTEIRMRKY